MNVQCKGWRCICGSETAPLYNGYYIERILALWPGENRPPRGTPASQWPFWSSSRPLRRVSVAVAAGVAGTRAIGGTCSGLRSVRPALLVRQITQGFLSARSRRLPHPRTKTKDWKGDYSGGAEMCSRGSLSIVLTQKTLFDLYRQLPSRLPSLAAG